MGKLMRLCLNSPYISEHLNSYLFSLFAVKECNKFLKELSVMYLCFKVKFLQALTTKTQSESSCLVDLKSKRVLCNNKTSSYLTDSVTKHS